MIMSLYLPGTRQDQPCHRYCIITVISPYWPPISSCSLAAKNASGFSGLAVNCRWSVCLNIRSPTSSGSDADWLPIRLARAGRPRARPGHRAGHCPGMVVLDSAVELTLPLRRGVSRVAPMLGPAFVAAVAYADPGNFATNFTAGAEFGYQLVWVVVGANLMAMLVQSLSAKLGVVTGRDLPQLCRDRLPRPVTIGLWAQAELVAMATDLAEIIGGALALKLLFGLPLPVGGLITCAVAFAVLHLHERGVRRFEAAIAGLLAVILLGFLYDLARSGADAGGLVRGMAPT